MAFHAKEGWYFERTEDGGVHLVSPDADVILDANTWCSAVASVTARGETGPTFNEAQSLHG